MTMTIDNAAMGLKVARVPNGVSLSYQRAGSGTPLVFIHGGMGDWNSFAKQWPTFVAQYDCVSYSRRYSQPNDNSMPSPDHSAFNEADDLRLLLDHLGLERVILVGSSYGAFTALAFAVKNPDRCLALVLSEPPMLRYALLSEAGRVAEMRFRSETIDPAHAAFLRGDDAEGGRILSGGIIGAAILDAAEVMAKRMRNIRAIKMLTLSSDEFPWIAPERLAALAMPILMLSGRKTTPVLGETFKNIVAAMPQADVHYFANCGHTVWTDDPDGCNRLTLDFLKRKRVETGT